MYNISLRQIDYFLTVAELESLTDAAKLLYVTQPAVSKSIALLEKELGIRLFERSYKGVRPTPEGALLYTEWKKLMTHFSESIAACHATEGGTREVLNIGCLDGFNYDSFLPQLVSKFENLYPEYKVRVCCYGFKELRERLLVGSCDLIFSTSFDLDNLQGICTHTIKKLTLYIAISSSHPLARREKLNMIDVRNEVFYILSPDESQNGGKKVLMACKRAGFTPSIRYVPNLQSLKMAIKQGEGVTICSDALDIGHDGLIKLCVSEDLLQDTYALAAWKKKSTKNSILRFVEFIKKREPVNQ
ncbi:MAG TPA: LysR family transcriptional regulator [Clostridiales bacterium]|jgi:DNA-binding transcriptional LysR family regulator|nr:LysR family transcriptional regulator [Clostridiales bacterium]